MEPVFRLDPGVGRGGRVLGETQNGRMRFDGGYNGRSHHVLLRLGIDWPDGPTGKRLRNTLISENDTVELSPICIRGLSPVSRMKATEQRCGST